jgi:hypothetical protein
MPERVRAGKSAPASDAPMLVSRTGKRGARAPIWGRGRRTRTVEASQCSRNSGHSDPGDIAACNALFATSSDG